MAFVPVLSWLAWIPALMAFLGLSRAMRSEPAKRKTSVNGLVMGIAAWLIAILVSVGSLGLGADTTSFAQAPAPTASQTAPRDSAPPRPTPTLSSKPTPTPRPTPIPMQAPVEGAAPVDESAPLVVVPIVPAPVEVAPAPAPAATFFQNCDAVRAAGAAPISVGQSGYSRKLDRDGDGVGCEP